MFLLIAQRRSSRPPDDQHPLGYGREAYFWALIAALGVFVTAAAFSLVGPSRVWIVVRTDIDDGLGGAQITSLVRGIESGMKYESEHIYRVDVVPIGDHGPCLDLTGSPPWS